MHFYLVCYVELTIQNIKATPLKNIYLLTPNRLYRDDAFNYDMLVNFFCTLFLFVCSIKCTAGGRPPRWRCIVCCRQIEKVCRKSLQAYRNWIRRLNSEVAR